MIAARDRLTISSKAWLHLREPLAGIQAVDRPWKGIDEVMDEQVLPLQYLSASFHSVMSVSTIYPIWLPSCSIEERRASR